MTYQQVRELVLERGPAKYHGRAFQLLRGFTDGLYKFRTQPTVEGKVKTVKTSTVMKWIGGISERQLRRYLERIEELQIVGRINGTIQYTMSFQALKSFTKSADVSKQQIKARKADRAAKARAARAVQRELKRLEDVQQFFRDLPEENRLRAERFNAVTA